MWPRHKTDPPPPPRGYFHELCMHIGYMCRARDPHFQPWISVPEHIIFTNYQKIRSGASPFYIFCRSGDHHFQNFFNFNPFIASHGRLSPNAKRSAAPRVSGRSGDTHFHAQNGSSSFRRFSFSRSKRIKLVPEPHIFTLKTAQARSGAPHFHARPGARSGALANFSLCRGTCLYTKIWVEYPPPPPGDRPARSRQWRDLDFRKIKNDHIHRKMIKLRLYPC